MDWMALLGVGLAQEPVWKTLALAVLCSAYIQGPITKILDFRSAINEMTRFGLSPAPVFAVIVIVLELTLSAMVISGVLRWAAALALALFTLTATFLTLRFWEMRKGGKRMNAMNTFFEHLGLAAAFLLVAAESLPTGLTQLF